LLKPPIPVETILASQPPVTVEDDEGDEATEALASDLRRFRARLAEAFDATLDALLRDVACAVVGRELSVSPCDVAALAADALKCARDEMPVGMRACTEDVARLQAFDLPIVVDPELRAGDLIVELRDGELDLRLGVRLEALLRDAAAFLEGKQ